MKKLDGYIHKSLLKLNEYLKTTGIYAGQYEAMIYFYGDFTKSLAYVTGMKAKYNLITNNCMQISAAALIKGKFKTYSQYYRAFLAKIAVRPIPNIAYLRLKSFHSSVTAYSKARWYRKPLLLHPRAAFLRY